MRRYTDTAYVTPRITALLKKLVVSQVAKKFPAF
jgi:hypothetical protein